jgi:hypothetical protein
METTLSQTPRLTNSQTLKRVSEALGTYRTWNVKVPPVDATGDSRSDQRLSEVFRSLLGMQGEQARLDHLHELLWTVHYAPTAEELKNKERPVLMRWWLDIDKAARAEQSVV